MTKILKGLRPGDLPVPFSFEECLISPLQSFVKILINYNLLKQRLTFILKYDIIYTG